MSSPDIPEWANVTEPLWRDFFDRIDKEVLREGIPDGWRNHPVVNTACEFAAIDELEVEMDFLVGRYSNFDELIAPNVPTSIHHLYHLARWEDSTGLKISEMETVLEWGGGYGSMARLIHMMNPSIEYVAVDHPVMLALHEHFHTADCARWPSNEADMIPQGFDLFVSTWAISESGAAAQDYVAKERRWFGADHLLIGFNASSDTFDGSQNFNDIMNEYEQEPGVTVESRYVFL